MYINSVTWLEGTEHHALHIESSLRRVYIYLNIKNKLFIETSSASQFFLLYLVNAFRPSWPRLTLFITPSVDSGPSGIMCQHHKLHISIIT